MAEQADADKQEPVDLREEILKKLGEPCPYCSGFGIKAWHPKELCPSKDRPRQ